MFLHKICVFRFTQLSVDIAFFNRNIKQQSGKKKPEKRPRASFLTHRFSATFNNKKPLRKKYQRWQTLK